jgi:multisubunit Na+/H+ antiporter MnhB subunit
MFNNIGGGLVAIAILATAFTIITFIWSFLSPNAKMRLVSKRSGLFAIACAAFGILIMNTLAVPTSTPEEIQASTEFVQGLKTPK